MSHQVSLIGPEQSVCAEGRGWQQEGRNGVASDNPRPLLAKGLTPAKIYLEKGNKKMSHDE